MMNDECQWRVDRDGKIIIISAAPASDFSESIPDSMQGGKLRRTLERISWYDMARHMAHVLVTDLRRTCDYFMVLGPFSSPMDCGSARRLATRQILRDTAAFGPSPDRCGGRRLTATGLSLTEISPDAICS